MTHILSIDEGTTGVTVTLFDERLRAVKQAESEFPQIYPKPGWVEHDAEEIWRVTERLVAEIGAAPAAIGITNQRETTVVWDRATGKPVHNAIVWQCRRTAPMCERLRKREPLFRKKTGLVLDAYFSGTKIAWILENVDGARAAAKAGRLAFGTVDTWLVWKMTGGRVHATDPTNASRTLLYDIDKRRWDDELCRILGIPMSMLPEVRPSTADFGAGVRGVAGDQQAALAGQGCFERGSSKNTYGTGCFLLVNMGARRPKCPPGLLTTLAVGQRGEAVYALEGAVFIAGAAVQWLRDSLRIIEKASDIEALARSVESSGGVRFVPAFVGLGAPYWDMDARGAILGLTRGAGRGEIARATLEAIAFQTRDVVEAMGVKLRELRVDGGACANDLLMQFQADLLGCRIARPKNIESTSLGAAFLAGMGAGLWKAGDLPSLLEVDRVFEPGPRREKEYAAWRDAVARVRVLPRNSRRAQSGRRN